MIYKLKLYLIKKSKSIICHGPYLVNQVQNIGYPKSSIIEFDSGVIDLHNNISQNVCPAVNDKFVILYIGRIEEDKGVFDLLNACRELLNYHVNLLYVGEGSSLSKLQEKVRDCEMPEFVYFRGKIQYNNLGLIFQTANLMVTPTRSTFPEGRCMSAMEGMSFGLPIIAPNAGPFPYIVEHGKNGLLFEQDSYEDLKRCVALLLENKSLYIQLSHQARVCGKKFKYPEVSFSTSIQKAFRKQTI